MPKKNGTEKSGDAGKAGSITQTVIISTLTTILGIVVGYLGTMQNAKAQIETARINIYGPIYATQTAEARNLPAASSLPPGPNAFAPSGMSIPISYIQVDGDIIGDSYETANTRTGEFELTSSQSENGYTSPMRSLKFFWDAPGRHPELHGLPMRGILATIQVSPSESLYAQELVMCHYDLLFNDHSYNSMEHFVPFGQPVTLLWDFSGRVFLPDYDFPEADMALIEDAADRVNSASSFTYYTKRTGELWQWQKLALDIYEPDKVQRIGISCNVSAAEDYRGEAPGRQFTFKGTVRFGDVIVFPYEQP